MSRPLVYIIPLKISLILFLMQLSTIFAQSSDPLGTITFGLEYDDRGTHIIPTDDGGNMFLGTLYNQETESQDMWLVELDETGEPIWQEIYGGSYTDIGSRVIPDSSGGYLMVGYTSSYGIGGFDAWLVKIDSTGIPVWQKTYGDSLDDYAFDVIPAEDGGYIIAGTTTSVELGKNDFWVFKVDLEGSILWETILGDFDQDQARSIKKTSDGGYIVAGYTVQDLITTYDLWLVKLDSEGDSLWSKIYGGSSRDAGISVQEMPDNRLMVLGYTESYSSSQDIWIIITDSEGNKIDSTTFGGLSRDYGHILSTTNDGNYIITGYTESYEYGDWDLLLLKINSNGNKIWSKNYGGNSQDFGQYIYEDESGGLVCIGITDSYGAGGWDAWVIWTDSTGNVAPPTLQDDLIAHYSFDGNANDMSGNGNDGVVYGANLTEDRLGGSNGAYYFDGVDDYIRVNDDDILTPTNNKMTVEMWAKVFYQTNRFFLYKGDSQINREYSMGFNRDSMAVFGINNEGRWTNGIDQFGVSSETTLEDSIWYHIVGTWDGVNHKLYLNGLLENTTTPPVVIGNYDSDLYIGSYGGDIPRYAINAAIDDIKIYNRALSAEEVLQLYSGNISADFSADVTYGLAPLTVKFSDQSTTSDSLLEINSWQWDFDNDGEIDSEEQNPEWTYLEKGVFTVKLTVSDSINQASITKENFITILSEEPIISSIEDIPNDQGGWVNVKFHRSSLDTNSIQLPKTALAELYTVEINDGSGWLAAASTLAYGQSIYSILVPTTKDKTDYDDGLIDFRVIAGMAEGNFVSNVVQGYSVDNLSPAVPSGVGGSISGDSEIILSWEPNRENDFSNYTIYRSENGSALQIVNQTTETGYTDTNIKTDVSYSYAVTAMDHSGNESDFSEKVIISIADIKIISSLPLKYYLSQNYPNPFNPVTTIKYGILNSGDVKVVIYDVLGNTINELVNKKQIKGHYKVIWNGSNTQNKSVSSGIYYYQILTKDFQEIKKMILVR